MPCDHRPPRPRSQVLARPGGSPPHPGSPDLGRGYCFQEVLTRTPPPWVVPDPRLPPRQGSPVTEVPLICRTERNHSVGLRVAQTGGLGRVLHPCGPHRQASGEGSRHKDADLNLGLLQGHRAEPGSRPQHGPVTSGQGGEGTAASCQLRPGPTTGSLQPVTGSGSGRMPTPRPRAWAGHRVALSPAQEPRAPPRRTRKQRGFGSEPGA